MEKKVAILQSNYIPWKGYFDLIASVDEFILYDDMQYTRRDWRNRNVIKSNSGLLWLTIPVQVKGAFTQRINETRVVDNSWIRKHQASINNFYAQTRYYALFKDAIFDVYRSCENDSYLSHINYKFLIRICQLLGIKTKISWSSDYCLVEGKTERLVDLCKQAGATEYISGPAAKNYIVGELFSNENIKLTWMDYSGYKEYGQLFPPFVHGVSMIDLLFNEGENAIHYMKIKQVCQETQE